MIDQVASWIDGAQRVVVLTGAGISTDSGIPDFRGPQGLWTKNPLAEKMSNIHYYLADPEVRKLSWQNRLASPAWTAKPNSGHLSLVTLEKRQKLHALITQNIDELHQIAGNSPELVVEVHGTMRSFMCWGCGMRGPMQKVLDRVRAGEPDPRCRDCEDERRVGRARARGMSEDSYTAANGRCRVGTRLSSPAAAATRTSRSSRPTAARGPS